MMPITTKEREAISRNLESQVDFRNSGFVSELHYILSFYGKIIYNDPIRTETGSAFQRNLEFMEFQAEFRNLGFITGWYYMPRGGLGKKSE